MVKLDKLVMQGFKSFRKKTVVPFPAGFNVVAGPNGSGKSNVVDAFTFVLGTLSTKSMRADRLHELIYHGHGQHKKADYAKVAIHVLNDDQKIPVPDKEIIISRKVNQKGISTYRINGKIETRNKVIDLLSHAHVFPDGHNIIMQGDITQIIGMNPVERREMIDEISGIAEYEDKKIKAQRELEKVDERLKEFEVIVKERETILEKLKNERDAALKWQKLSDDLRKMKASLNKIKIEKIEKDYELIQKEIEEKTKSIKEMSEVVERIDKEMEMYEKESRKLVTKIIDNNKDLIFAKQIEEVRGEMTRVKDKIAFNQGEAQRLDSMIEKVRELEGQGNKAVETILKLNRPGVYGSILQLFSCPEEYTTAIEVTAGNHLNDIIVKDDKIAEEMIEYLKRERIGRATFLPLNTVKPQNPLDSSLQREVGAIGWAIDLIEFDKQYYNAFSHIFGSTLIIDSINAARNIGIGKARMVTLEGDLIERSGAMVGGFYKRKRESNVQQYVHARDELIKDIEILKSRLPELEKKLKSLVGDGKEDEKQDVSQIDQQRLEIETKYEKIRIERKKSYEQMLRDQDKLGRLKIDKARLEAQLDNLRLEQKEYAGVDSFYRREIAELEEDIRIATRELNSLGIVNLKSIQEFEIIKNEFIELSKKFYKLKEERIAVLQMMEEVEAKRRETFMKTFNAVREYFQTLYNKATKGQGDLELEDPNNIDTGLLIRANPASKSLINMDSLSGGEKTMAALTFLFALQKTRPAPFYILDEVDAALDKANASKVVELVKELSSTAQFIVISHNDTTIASADRVIGVSMSNGESSIVGVELTVN